MSVLSVAISLPRPPWPQPRTSPALVLRRSRAFRAGSKQTTGHDRGKRSPPSTVDRTPNASALVHAPRTAARLPPASAERTQQSHPRRSEHTQKFIRFADAEFRRPRAWLRQLAHWRPRSTPHRPDRHPHNGLHGENAPPCCPSRRKDRLAIYRPHRVGVDDADVNLLGRSRSCASSASNSVTRPPRWSRRRMDCCAISSTRPPETLVGGIDHGVFGRESRDSECAAPRHRITNRSVATASAGYSHHRVRNRRIIARSSSPSATDRLPDRHPQCELQFDIRPRDAAMRT